MNALRDNWRTVASEYYKAFTAGRYDARAYLWFIYPEEELHETDDGASLVIGRAGGDGIEFALRRDYPGIWAFYPIDAEWRAVAPDITTFEQDWLSGRLKV